MITPADLVPDLQTAADDSSVGTLRPGTTQTFDSLGKPRDSDTDHD